MCVCVADTEDATDSSHFVSVASQNATPKGMATAVKSARWLAAGQRVPQNPKCKLKASLHRQKNSKQSDVRCPKPIAKSKGPILAPPIQWRSLSVLNYGWNAPGTSWYSVNDGKWIQMGIRWYTMVYDDIRWYTHMHAFLMPAIKTSWPECQSVCWVRAWMPWTMLRQRPIFRNSADASFSPVWQVGSHRYCQIQPVLHRGIYNAECQLHILLVAIWELPNVLT